MKSLYSELTGLVAHPLGFLVCAEQHFLTALKSLAADASLLSKPQQVLIFATDSGGGEVTFIMIELS